MASTGKTSLKIIKTELDIGLKKEVRLLHVTDSHLTWIDDRDNERKQQLCVSRREVLHDPNGSRAQAYLDEQIKYAEENCDLLVHSGNLIDFLTMANLDYTRTLLQNPNIFFIAGNHDYSQFCGEAWEDLTYRMNSCLWMDRKFVANMFFNSRVVGNVNIVGIDNAYYRFADWQIGKLRQEAEKGLPVILVFNHPLFEQSLYDYVMKNMKRETAGLVGCDEEHLLPYTEYAAMQQRPDEATKQMIDYISREPRIKAILTGSLPINRETKLPDGKIQYITAGGYEGNARELILK